MSKTRYSVKAAKLRAKANDSATTPSERRALRRAAVKQDTKHREEQAKGSSRSPWATNYGPPI